MKKKNWGVVAVFAVIIAGFLALLCVNLMSKHQNQIKWDDYNLNSYIGPNEFNGEIGDNVKGDKDKAKVFIVEYADFQCPGCASLNNYVNKIPEKFDYKVAVIYRNFVMSYHQKGTAAVTAHLCGEAPYICHAYGRAHGGEDKAPAAGKSGIRFLTHFRSSIFQLYFSDISIYITMKSDFCQMLFPFG